MWWRSESTVRWRGKSGRKRKGGEGRSEVHGRSGSKGGGLVKSVEMPVEVRFEIELVTWPEGIVGLDASGLLLALEVAGEEPDVRTVGDVPDGGEEVVERGGAQGVDLEDEAAGLDATGAGGAVEVVRAVDVGPGLGAHLEYGSVRPLKEEAAPDENAIGAGSTFDGLGGQ